MPNCQKNLSLFPKENSSLVDNPLYYESIARKNGYSLIAGVDEVGRGPLAGPVVAAAVILPEGVTLFGVKDSKKMTEKAREDAFSVINENAIAVAVSVVPHQDIDQTNILIATLKAMKQAVLSLDPVPDYILVDGNQKFPISIPQECIKKGDQLSQSISAASIMAKVYRDAILRSYHDNFPEYNFKNNKGYGTLKHMAALKQHGPCPIHRLTFRGVC